MVIVERCILCGNWPATGDFCQQCVMMAALAIYVEPATVLESHGTGESLEAMTQSQGGDGPESRRGQFDLPTFDDVIGSWEPRAWSGLDPYRK